MTTPSSPSTSSTPGGRPRGATAGAPTESVERLPGPDVVRAVALIGVVVMNYHGYLILRGAPRGDGWAAELFDPFTGPLSTRFAATFVLMAGVGVTLLTRRVVAARDAGDPDAGSRVVEMRWRLVRRGLALYVLGELLDIIWPGTIIVYYGVMFVLAALLFTLRTTWVVAVGVAAAIAGWLIEAWATQRGLDGGDVTWLRFPPEDSIRRVVLDVMVNGTHPLLPWLAFFCAGIVLGRLLGTERLEMMCVALGLVLVGVGAVLSSLGGGPLQTVMLSVRPLDRGIVYVASALGTALIGFGALSALTTQLSATHPAWVDPLRRAGQMTLTIYIAHILVFNALVDTLELIEPGGLATSLTFAAVFWALAIAGAAWWQRSLGRGPAEQVYRRLGG